MNKIKKKCELELESKKKHDLSFVLAAYKSERLLIILQASDKRKSRERCKKKRWMEKGVAKWHLSKGRTIHLLYKNL